MENIKYATGKRKTSIAKVWLSKGSGKIMRSLQIMSETGYPVIFDATHSVQQPGGKGDKSGGQREFIHSLSRAAVAVGVAGLFIETHEDPDNAPSDGPNMLPLSELKDFLNKIMQIDNLIKSYE